MIVAAATFEGFQKQIAQKVFGFWGHIHITKYSS
jgi:ABC-type lipoprotein release transport system permease subunit